MNGKVFFWGALAFCSGMVSARILVGALDFNPRLWPSSQVINFVSVIVVLVHLIAQLEVLKGHGNDWTRIAGVPLSVLAFVQELGFVAHVAYGAGRITWSDGFRFSVVVIGVLSTWIVLLQGHEKGGMPIRTLPWLVAVVTGISIGAIGSLQDYPFRQPYQWSRKYSEDLHDRVIPAGARPVSCWISEGVASFSFNLRWGQFRHWIYVVKERFQERGFEINERLSRVELVRTPDAISWVSSERTKFLLDAEVVEMRHADGTAISIVYDGVSKVYVNFY